MERDAPVERRLAAIVATDIVGYSRLVGADEEGTLARLGALRREVIDPIIARYHGRIVKTTGDGLLIEFASIVAAVRCACDILGGLAGVNRDAEAERKIRLRIGINLGDIVVQDGDILGDGVNIAARLEQIAEPESIYLSHAAWEQLDGRLSVAVEPLGERQLKNIARPIRVYRITQPGQTPEISPGSARRRGYARLPYMAAALAIVALAGGGTWWYLSAAGTSGPAASNATGPTRPGADRLRAQGRAPVAVLPLANLAADRKEDYFSDGLTEEIIDGLGRYSGLSVVAYTAVYPLKDSSGDEHAAIARRLGVRYLVSGSVRRASERVRILVRLADVEQDRLVWSQQFDSTPAEIMDLQEQITRRIVGALAVRLTKAEQDRINRKPTDSLEAYDLVLRGRALVASPGRAANVEARSLFQRAAEIDPRYADSFVELGRSYRIAVDQGWTPRPRDTLRQAEAAVRKAIELDDRNSRAHALLGRILLVRQEFDLAAGAARKALELNPSDSEGYWSLGTVLLYSGKIDEAIDALETARAYNPTRDEYSTLSLSLAYYVAGRSRAAVDFIEGTIGRDASHTYTYFVLAMAYAQLGNTQEANAIADMARRLNPVFEPGAFGSLFRDHRHQALIHEGLRKIGFH